MRPTCVQTTAPSSDTQTYTLDALGNRIAHSRVSGAWTYDANNRLTQRGNGAGATSYRYDNAGNLTQKLEAGATTTYRYDTQNRLIEVALAQSVGIEQVIARYGYDPQDRRIWKEQYASKTGEPLFMAQRTLYLYSDQGLLAEAPQPFVLDPRLTITTVEVPPPRVIVGPGPVITGPLPLPMVSGVSGVGVGVGVSATPTMVGSGITTTTASGVRVSPTPAPVQAASPSPRVLSMASGELVPLGPVPPTITTQYGLRPDSPWGTAPLFIQTKNSAGQTSMAYYHHDQLGTPLQATDKAGNIVWAASFDAFGRASITTPQATPEKPTIASNLRLPGQYEDGETGLHYNWHRYYDAEVGRYVTADPIGFEGGINTFVYADGSPFNRVDVEGKNWVGIVAAVMAGYAVKKVYDKYAKLDKCNKECAVACAGVASCGDPDKTQSSFDNQTRCIKTCQPLSNPMATQRPISISSISLLSKSLIRADNSTPLTLASAASVVCTCWSRYTGKFNCAPAL